MAFAAALLGAPAALADTTNSSNWAGYAVHGARVSYRTVRGSWRQPSVTCTRGVQTFSSFWVGLGGYGQASSALEQIGTEVDCTSAGQTRSTAWYELVPEVSVELQLELHPADVMHASVTVSGNRVSLSLYDSTRRHGFAKTVTAATIDVSSAEWIVEAPSACVGDSSCQTLPLANFGTVAFESAQATPTGGITGGISNPAWQASKIKLSLTGRRFAAGGGSGTSTGSATPSALAPDGRSFKVAYAQVPVATEPVAGRSSALLAGGLLHPERDAPGPGAAR